MKATSIQPPSGRPPSAPPQAPGTRIAECELRTNELQELADQVMDLKRATVGYEVKLTVRIEVGGKPVVGDDVVARVNAVLAKVKNDLKLQ